MNKEKVKNKARFILTIDTVISPHKIAKMLWAARSFGEKLLDTHNNTTINDYVLWCNELKNEE